MVDQLLIAAVVSFAGAGFGLVAGRLLTRRAPTPEPVAAPDPAPARLLDAVLAPYDAALLAGQ